jgi:8-hydroxy-5-deazaflavin:NADPH oxidoreductase
MKIAVLGTGMVGQTIAGKLAELGHEVIMGTRDAEKAKSRKGTDAMGRPAVGDWLSMHPEIKLATLSEAAAAGEIIVNATSGFGTLDALGHAGSENLRNKVLIDIANPLDFSKGMPPTLWVCNTDSLGEQIQKAFPEAKVVKALNTMNAYLMVNPSLVPGDHSVFMSGNDAEAKKAVLGILASFGWKTENIIDLGDITTARGTEQMLPIWVRLMGVFGHPVFNFSIVKGTPAQR